MPAIIQFSVEPAEALRLGLPFFDMYIQGWGAGSDIYVDGSGFVYPLNATDIRLPAPRGIMIHPESDFDRVIVETSLGSGIVGASIAHPTPLNRQSFTVTVDAPLILTPPTIPLPAGGVTPTPTVTLRCHQNAIYHATYAKSGGAALTAFNTALVPIAVEQSAFNGPVLVLRFFMQTPPMPLGRSPQVFPRPTSNYGTARTYAPVAVNHATTPGEQLFAIIPTHGRKCVTTLLRSVGCAPTVRIAANDFSSLNPAAVPVAGDGNTQMERTLVTTTALTSNVPTQASYSPSSDWLMLYYTPSVGDNGLLMWQVRLSP